MKHRVLDALSEALDLVRQSDLAKATAVIRKALSEGEARSDTGVPEARPQRPAARVVAPSARRSLGETLRALRTGPSFPPAAPVTPQAEPPNESDPRFLRRTHVDPAGSLSYRLYVPADYERRELALVLMLHGCTQDPEDFALGTQMNAVADEFGLIVAYPHQPRRANASGCWNWFDRRHQKRGSGEPARLAGLAQALAKEFGVDNERIFAAGLSAGGAMAEVLAATYPDVFAAVGVHSGLPYRSAVDVPSAFAAMKGTAAAGSPPPAANGNRCRKIIIHGGADATVHPMNGERILDQAGLGATPLKRIDLEWRTDGGRVSRTVLKDPAGRPVAEHFFVEEGGHAWFGGDPRGSFTQTIGVDASRIMVRFFLQQGPADRDADLGLSMVHD
jgi:poly(hydroxyalkanoate) depolymerase family esterase